MTNNGLLGTRHWAVALGVAVAAQGCMVQTQPMSGGQPAPAAAEPAATEPSVEQVTPDPEGNDESAQVEDFYEPLSSYGNWVDAGPYGRVWQPSEEVAGQDFTPYTSDGGWVQDDDGQWNFQSKYDNEWGWATYHYGRWVQHEDYGWVWAPGTVWAPAWVEWRYGGGYVGWAPLAPAGVVCGPERWAFVEEVRFGEPLVGMYRLEPARAYVAYGLAMPIVEVRGRARWYVGPSAVRLRSAGVSVRTAHFRRPGRGYVRAHASATVRARGGARVRAASGPHHRGARPAAAQPAHAEPAHHEPAHHEPAHHEPAHAEPAHHEAKAGHPEKAAGTHHDAKPVGVPAAKPKPAPAPAAKPKKKK